MRFITRKILFFLSVTVLPLVTVTAACPDYVQSVDLGLSIRWANVNIDATAPEEYGKFYAWGETTSKNNFDWSKYHWMTPGQSSENGINKYTSSDRKKVLDPEDDAARVAWGDEWRTPTQAEWQELMNQCTWIYSTINGINGYIVKSKTNDNSIFIPFAGYKFSSTAYSVSTMGSYWSSSLCDTGSAYRAYIMNGYRTSSDMPLLRYQGCTIRPVTTAVNYYTIRFVNYDGQVLQEKRVKEGDTPKYLGATPTRPSTAQYWYKFICWDKDIHPATQDETYTATYNTSTQVYTITVSGSNCTTSGGGKFLYGDNITITAKPKNQCDAFVRWSDEPEDGPTAGSTRTVMVEGNYNYVAIIAKATYNISTSPDNPTHGVTEVKSAK